MTETKVLTNALLKGILTDAVVQREFISLDFNDYTTSGMYWFNHTGCTNCPRQAMTGFLLVFATSSQNLLQLFFWADPEFMYFHYRVRWLGGFRTWKKVPS